VAEEEIAPAAAAALDRARAALARGEGIPHEEILQRFGPGWSAQPSRPNESPSSGRRMPGLNSRRSIELRQCGSSIGMIVIWPAAPAS
jgi:hypothetical protein